MELHIKNPHQRAIITLTGLVGFWLTGTLALWGLSSARIASSALVWISSIFLAFFTLLWGIIWLLSRLQMQRAKAFFSSNRPLVRWEYSTAEWQQLKENLWQEENQDWKLQWGCLTILLALAGSLTGGMLGIEDGILQIGLNVIFGFGVGALFGGLIGALVAGGNYWGARTAYRNPQPGQVALGPNEIFVNGDYFKGDGVNRSIQGAKIRSGNPTTLEFELLFPPRPRMPREETWSVPVPAKSLESVERVLSRVIGNTTGASE